ncbi:MAG: hypothetical protein C5B53_05935 [Candidatus Melainabacteria bacterium]|nr:MAG: hypothetical protein C5B53_05935 [Candidatus Melainabacteria bacterium]
MHMNTAILLFAWWVFVGVVGYALFAFMRLLSSPKSRSSLGDISTEVGYSVDPYGVSKVQDADTASDATSMSDAGFTNAVGHTGGPGV